MGEWPYEDILHLPHPVSKRHPRASMEDRAAQFAAFEALTGHEEAVVETARLTETKPELADSVKQRLDETMQRLLQNRDEEMQLYVQFFVADKRKQGGAIKECISTVKKVNLYERVLILSSGMEIPFDDLLDMELLGKDDEDTFL